jgi:hypothetical protein
MELSQFPFSQVAAWLTEGKIVPFLGAGASRVGITEAVPLPDGRTLALELIKRMGGAFPGKQDEELAKVAQFFEQSVFDRPALYEYIVSRFRERQADVQTSAVAQLLATVPVTGQLFLMTTNYDLQIERAMRAANRPLCVITQNMRDPGHGASLVEVTYPDGTFSQEAADHFQWNDPARIPDPGTVYLYKMHGSAGPRVIRSERDDIIITEDDYVDFLLNCGGPVSPYFPPPSLANVYKERRFLFLGYSLEDWNFRAFLRLLALRHALSGREQLKHWAIQLDPGPLDEPLWRQRNVNLYKGDLAEFCRDLEACWPREESA